MAARDVVRWVACGCLVLAGCTDAGTPQESAPASTWTATFEQDRPDQDSPNANVKLRNGSDDVTVTGVRLAWSGYTDGGWQPADMAFAAGDTHRLDVKLTTPRCSDDPDDPDNPPQVELLMADESTAAVPLDEAGVTVLRRVWDRQCGEQRLLDAVDVRLGVQWRSEGGALVGELRARRGSSQASATVVEARGSVLLDFALTGRDRTLLEAGEGKGALPVRVEAAGRCDAHALAESSQTFKLRVWVSLDGGAEQSLVIVPDKAARTRMDDMIRSACGLT